jgi:hypothetical protein
MRSRPAAQGSGRVRGVNTLMAESLGEGGHPDPERENRC